jgi:excisionase family DNA binding protein
MPNDDTITITEAARRLNVSERTVYRMLKSGKLTRVYRYDSVRILSVDVENLRSNTYSIVSDNVSHLSERDMESLRGQIAEKDMQIAQLLARQQEMSKMLERLQEQLYELTRYVLEQAKTPPKRGFLASFWRRDRRSNKDSGEDR